jgi:hypothetical protein
MNALKTPLTFAAITLLATGLTTNTAQAVSDAKEISPATCIPYAPSGTVLTDLTVNSTGIYNPGTTIKTVLCPMPRDSETNYSTSSGTSVNYGVWYRVSGGSGRVTCTLYVGSSAVDGIAVYTHTVSGPAVGSGARSNMTVSGAETAGGATIGSPANMICSIYPKTTLGEIFQIENVATNTP